MNSERARAERLIKTLKKQGWQLIRHVAHGYLMQSPSGERLTVPTTPKPYARTMHNVEANARRHGARLPGRNGRREER